MNKFCTAIILSLVCAAGAQAGYEDFANFAEGGSYANGSFTGRDGSTWTYLQCRGDQVIDAPSPCLDKGETPASHVTSGVLTGGCAELTFEWQKEFTSDVNLDVAVNDIVLCTVTGGIQNVVFTNGPLVINQAGDFTLKFVQHNTAAGQVSIDNISWTSYGGGGERPPSLLFSPATTNPVIETNEALSVTITATEADGDPVRLWASSLPAGANFAGATGAAPLACVFSWTPTAGQTGAYPVVFLAGDKDGTNSRTMTVTVEAEVPYYYQAQGKTGAELKQALHEIISSGTYQLSDLEEDNAMKTLDTDPANTNNVILLYRRISMAKPLYNDNSGWNKEHCWPESRGLGSDGPDQNDVHNLYAADKTVNALRGNLYFDESDPTDPGYLNPAATNAPLTSRDGDSWEPPDEVKGNVARACFYMDVRYDGNEGNTVDLTLSEAQSDPAEGKMGILSTLLAWHAADPPDLAESNRNEIVFADFQYNRNPFIDHPEWVASIWETNATPPVLLPIGAKSGSAGALLSFAVQALPTEGDAVTLSMSNAPAGALLSATNGQGTFAWTPSAAGSWTVNFYASDNDGSDHEAVSLLIGADTQNVVVVQYTFEDAVSNFTAYPQYMAGHVGAGIVGTGDGVSTNMGGNPGRAISDTGWATNANLTAYFKFVLAISNGYELLPSSLIFQDLRSSTGPQTWRVRSSHDGYVADWGSGSTHTAWGATNQCFVSGITASESLEIRIYGQQAGASNGTWRMDNLFLIGQLRAVQAGDSDHDGLPDDWESLYFGGSTNAMADDDADEDGFPNIQECITGTNPTNSASRFEAAIVFDAQGLRIGSEALGTSCVFAVDLGTLQTNRIVWQELATTNKNPSAPLEFHIAVPQTGGFYRLRAWLPE